MHRNQIILYTKNDIYLQIIRTLKPKEFGDFRKAAFKSSMDKKEKRKGGYVETTPAILAALNEANILPCKYYKVYNTYYFIVVSLS